jgi:hypothetical protein
MSRTQSSTDIKRLLLESGGICAFPGCGHSLVTPDTAVEKGAICANGPRQNDKLRPIVEARGGLWEELPSDTFISAGTSVRTVLLMLDA